MKQIEKTDSKSNKGEIKPQNEKLKKELIDQAFIQFSQACVENAGK